MIGLMIIPVYSQNKSKQEALNEFLTALAENDRFMGSVAVSVDGEVDFAEAYGAVQIIGDKMTDADQNTIYRIGSISKVFTTVMVTQLIDEGLIDYKTGLNTYFPEIENAELINIEQLLSHQSGITNITNDEDYLVWCYEPTTKEEMVKRIKKAGSVFEPGTQHSYSNSNYILLGYIIEEVTGKSFQKNLLERICRPLGLNSTSYGSDIRVDKGHAHSYVLNAGKWEEQNQTDMSVPHGAGALISTPTDLVKFSDAVFKNGFVGAEHLAKMKAYDEESGYGLGCFPYPFHDQMGFGHSGGIDGFFVRYGVLS